MATETLKVLTVVGSPAGQFLRRLMGDRFELPSRAFNQAALLRLVPGSGRRAGEFFIAISHYEKSGRGLVLFFSAKPDIYKRRLNGDSINSGKVARPTSPTTKISKA